MLTLREPTLEDLYEVAKWRNLAKETLRTSGETTNEQQEQFYKNVICNDDSKHEYFSVYYDTKLIGFTGLTDINYENMNAEISLILNPQYRRQGYGSKIMFEMLEYAFEELFIFNVYGECYLCNNALDFWFKIIDKYDGSYTILPDRKIYDGLSFDSIYFTINKRGFKYGKVYPGHGKCEHQQKQH